MILILHHQDLCPRLPAAPRSRNPFI